MDIGSSKSVTKRLILDAADLFVEGQARASGSLTFEGTRHQLVGKILETVRQDTRHAIQSLRMCSRNTRNIDCGVERTARATGVHDIF